MIMRINYYTESDIYMGKVRTSACIFWQVPCIKRVGTLLHCKVEPVKPIEICHILYDSFVNCPRICLIVCTFCYLRGSRAL